MAACPGHCPVPRSAQVTLWLWPPRGNWTPQCSLCLQSPHPCWGLPTCPKMERKSSALDPGAVLVLPERGAPELPWGWALAAPALCAQRGCGLVESSHVKWVMQGAQHHNDNSRNANKQSWGVPAPRPGQLGPGSGSWHSLRDKRARRPGMAGAAGGTNCWQTNRKQALPLAKSKRESKLPIFSTR